MRPSGNTRPPTDPEGPSRPMFYRTDDDHPLPYNPFKAIVAPRPIGWIATLGADGSRNLAPYSYFNAVHDAPPMVVFSSTGWKDTVRNAQATGEFTCNYVTRALGERMNATSTGLPPGTDEFEAAGLEAVASETVAVPRVAGVPAALECKVVAIVPLATVEGEAVDAHAVFGQVTGVHIDDAILTDGRFDVAKADPIMRMGYRDYSALGPVFEMVRPG